MPRIQTGLDVLLATKSVDLATARLGVLANQASVDSQLRSTWEVLAEAYPQQMAAMFSPQHGFWGEQQANMIESAHEQHPVLGVPVYSLYSETRRPTAQMLAIIDVLIVDLQDVGTRVYTFIWTLLHCLRACATAGVDVVVLDRPNPVGGTNCEGAVLEPEFRSFVGDACIPMRHALTIAEMAAYLNGTQQIGASLKVISMQGWRRDMLFEETGLPWVPPSPNLPTPRSAVVYPGQVLLEGTNLSEGRGTTTPFELVGAPFIESFRLADAMNDRSLPGVRFRPARFRPTFDKWAGEVCGGVALHVTDATLFAPYHTTLELLSAVRQLAGDAFNWISPPYEYETQKMPIDILSGDDRLRIGLEQGGITPLQIEQLCRDGVDEWRDESQQYWLYPT